MRFLPQNLHLEAARMTQATHVCTVIAEITGLQLECLESSTQLSGENQ